MSRLLRWALTGAKLVGGLVLALLVLWIVGGVAYGLVLALPASLIVVVIGVCWWLFG